MSDIDTQFASKVYIEKYRKIEEHLQKIVLIVKCVNDPLEGNCFYKNGTAEKQAQLLNKRLNLISVGDKIETRICEIGFNAGHSAMLLSLGGPEKFEFTVFDNCYHKYTLGSFEYIKSQYPGVKFEFIVGDSTKTVPHFIENRKEYVGTYDVVHVDGGHDERCVSSDMRNADKLVRKEGLLVVDDTHNAIIRNWVGLMLMTGDYDELDILPTQMYPHRILRKVN